MDTLSDDPQSTDLEANESIDSQDELLTDSVDEDNDQPKTGFGERIGEDDATLGADEAMEDNEVDEAGDDGMAPIEQP